MHARRTMRVRRARADDAAVIAAIHVHSWQAAYRGILPDALLDGLSVAERERTWAALLSGGDEDRLALVAEDPAGELVGFCSVATPILEEGIDEQPAEIGALYVDPGHWREGAGSAMLAAVLEELGGRGRSEAILWVLPENRPALAFYERFGFAVDPGVETIEERSGRRVIRLRTRLEEPVRIVPYDPEWPRCFELERTALEEAIGPWATGGIHHVGSTAVPGLAAKPIVDVLVGVDSLDASRACFDPLAGLGYLYAPYLAEEMHWFCKPHPSRRTHHLHLVPTGSPRFREELAFRDLLRADPALADEYEALKRDLAERLACDRDAYTEAKGDFIGRALRRG